jgi:hypothetical protein
MKIRSIINNVCLVIATACLATGYILGGYWLVMPIFLAMAIFCIIMKRRSALWSASTLLVAYVFLAATGMIINLSIYPMIFGCTAALACWDLFHFGQSIADNLPGESSVLLERHHLRSLGAAVLSGLLLSLITSYISLQFPFGLMIVLALVSMGGLTFGLQSLIKHR